MRAIATFFALCFLLLPRAFGDTGAVVVGGKIEERDQATARHAAEESVRSAGWTLDSKPLPPRDVNAITACLHDVAAWPCVARIVGARGIRRVAAVNLQREPTASGVPQVIITERLVVEDVELVVIGQRFCERCTDDTLSELTIELTKELLQRAALESGRTVLAVRSMPQRALYSVDGVLSGVTDATINIVPGTHVVTIEHDGFESATRTIEAVEGKTAEVTVTLVRRVDSPLPGHSPTDPPKSPVPDRGAGTVAQDRSRALPISLVVVGALAVGGGATALAFNQHDVTKPANERQPHGYYDTVPAGAASIVVGVAVAGFGGYLWWKRSRDNSPAPTIAPVSGGAVVGLWGAF